MSKRPYKLESSSVNHLAALTLCMAAFPASARDVSTYTVPQGPRLTEDVTIPLQRASFRENGRKATLQYDLPRELDGTTPHRFALKGSLTNGKWYLTDESQSASAICEGSSRDFVCTVEYATNAEGIFPIDKDSANAYLATRTDLTPAQIEKFQLAQDVLSHEPIGIVRGHK